MKTLRFLAIALFPLVMALLAFAASAKTYDEYKRTDPELLNSKTRLDEAQLQKRAFFLACVWSQYSCGNLDRPYVVYEDLSEEPGLLGYYIRGTDVVHVNQDLKGTTLGFLVLVHETVHYLQSEGGSWSLPLSKEKSCGLEEEAFNVMYRVSVAIGLPYDYKWRGWDAMRAFTYGCPEDPPNPVIE